MESPRNHAPISNREVQLEITRCLVVCPTLLLEKGEEQLITAVDSGVIPLSLAVIIARGEDGGVQQALAKE